MVAEAVEGDINCLACAVVIEANFKKIEEIDRVSISMSRQMVAATFKEGARFLPAVYREAIAKAEVRVKAFNLTMRGTALKDDGKTYFVAGENRFLIANPPGDLPLGVSLRITAAVDDATEPYEITSIAEMKPL
jgi:hypothetical protein